MSLNDSLSEVERAKLAVWDYPVSDKYTKMWQAMKEAGLPNTLEEAVERVRASKSSSEGFAYLGDATDIKYLELTNCDLVSVGEEFSRKPYAIAIQQGSPLKDQFNAALVKMLFFRLLKTYLGIDFIINAELIIDIPHLKFSSGDTPNFQFEFTSDSHQTFSQVSINLLNVTLREYETVHLLPISMFLRRKSSLLPMWSTALISLVIFP